MDYARLEAAKATAADRISEFIGSEREASCRTDASEPLDPIAPGGEDGVHDAIVGVERELEALGLGRKLPTKELRSDWRIALAILDQQEVTTKEEVTAINALDRIFEWLQTPGTGVSALLGDERLEFLQNKDLTEQDALLLNILLQSPIAMAVVDLAAHVELDRKTVGNRLAHLKVLGLVAPPTGHKARLVRITEAGQAWVEKNFPISSP